MKLFVYYTNGYNDVFNNIKKIYIKKIDRKNHLEIDTFNKTERDLIPLNEIELCFMVDTETMKEYFRYEK